MTLKKPFSFGSLTLPSNVFCAPLAGCSDVPFRKMLIKHRPGLIYCEMVKMGALIHGNPQTQELLDYDASMHPIGAQICGSCPKMAAECAKMIEDKGFDILDLNCGCPVDKITKDGSGSGMLKNPELIGEVISSMVASVKIPVSVKIRTGWDEGSIVAPQVTQIAEQAGAVAICIHGRTREQGYKGNANWDYIRDCKQVAKQIKVIGNGDIFDGPSAEKIFTHTGCDAILLARGSMGKPWLIDEVYTHLSGEPPIIRTAIDFRDAFLEHLDFIASYRDPRKAVMDARRVGGWFLRGFEAAAELRKKINSLSSISEIREATCNHPWQGDWHHHCELTATSK